MYQEIAWQVSLVLMGLLALVFAGVALAARRRVHDYAPLQKRAYRIRAVFFWALVLTATPVMLYTLMGLPFDIARAANSVPVIDAVGHQWRWQLSADRVTAGQEVEFRVTSADVNHGFGIYDADLRLVAQTQAMPGYTNRLRHTFAKPGTYRILCMEYCGLVHHNMVTEITVTE
jgi:cytochrome c oxidase subunit 2